MAKGWKPKPKKKTAPAPTLTPRYVPPTRGGGGWAPPLPTYEGLFAYNPLASSMAPQINFPQAIPGGYKGYVPFSPTTAALAPLGTTVPSYAPETPPIVPSGAYEGYVPFMGPGSEALATGETETGAPVAPGSTVDSAMDFYFSKGGRNISSDDYEKLKKMTDKMDDQQWDDFNQRTRSIELWGRDPGLMGWEERRAFENRLYREQAMQRPGDTRTRFGQVAGTGTPVQGAGVGTPGYTPSYS